MKLLNNKVGIERMKEENIEAKTTLQRYNERTEHIVKEKKDIIARLKKEADRCTRKMLAKKEIWESMRKEVEKLRMGERWPTWSPKKREEKGIIVDLKEKGKEKKKGFTIKINKH